MSETEPIRHSDIPHFGTEEQMNDTSIATRFTTDHGIDDPDDDAFYFAFICPQCDEKNPMKGQPASFGNKPFACSECGYLSLLPAEAIVEFEDTTENDKEPDQ